MRQANFAFPAKAQPSGDKTIHICGLEASVGYER